MWQVYELLFAFLCTTCVALFTEIFAKWGLLCSTVFSKRMLRDLEQGSYRTIILPEAGMNSGLSSYP